MIGSRSLCPALFAIAACAIGCGPVTIDFPLDSGVWPPRSALPFAAKGRLAITNNNDDTMAFVSLDLPTPALYAIAPVGDIPVEIEGPHFVVAPASGEFLYVVISNYAPGTGSGPHGAHGLGTLPGALQKFRARDMALLGEAPLLANAGEARLSSDGKTAYVTNYDLAALQAQVQKQLPASAGFSSVAMIDVATMTKRAELPVCATAHDMELSSDDKTLYVTCQQTDELAIVDLAAQTASRVPVGPAPGMPLNPLYQPLAVTRSSADGTLWISCNSSADIRVYDPKKQAIDTARTVSLGGMGIPMYGAFLSDGKTLLVPLQGTELVVLVDTSTSSLRATIPLPPTSCFNARDVVITAGDRIAYVVCEGDQYSRKGSVVAIDVPARQVLGFVETGLYSDSVALLPPAP